MVRVKVCGMRDAQNIRDVAETGPDMMGFIFHPGSPRYVGDSPDPSLFRQAGAGTLTTGVFVNAPVETILALAGRYALRQVQLHGQEVTDDCRTLKEAGYVVVKAFAAGRNFDFTTLAAYVPVCDYFLFDSPTEKHGGSGLKFRWNLLSNYHYEKPFFLSGGIGPDDAAAILALHHPALYAVDINSRFEISPGLKDVRKVKTFISQIKNREA